MPKGRTYTTRGINSYTRSPRVLRTWRKKLSLKSLFVLMPLPDCEPQTIILIIKIIFGQNVFSFCIAIILPRVKSVINWPTLINCCLTQWPDRSSVTTAHIYHAAFPFVCARKSATPSWLGSTGQGTQNTSIDLLFSSLSRRVQHCPPPTNPRLERRDSEEAVQPSGHRVKSIKRSP